MNETDIHDFCDELNIFLMSVFHYRRPLARVGFRVIDCNRKKVDLSLRWYSSKSRIVIARMYFKSTRKGYGTRLIEFLIDASERFGYREVEIECANQNSSAFAKKIGFKNVAHNHWRGSIGMLKKNLEYI